MTHDDIQQIKDLLNDELGKWRLDVGDWIGFAEELLEEVERLRDELHTLRVHSDYDIIDIDSDCFVYVSAAEFDQVMNRVFGT